MELAFPAAEFALSETFERLPDLRCAAERGVAHGTERSFSMVWFSGGEYATAVVTAALEHDRSVRAVELVADIDTDSERLYRVEWCARVERLIEVFLSERGTVLAASCEGGSWFVRLLYPMRESLSRVANRCEAADFRFDIKRIYGLDGGHEERFGLTDKQRTVLEAALESGYYEVPRETNASQLATELDVSHQALSERLRRAHKNLVENTLTTGHLSE